MPRKAIKPPKTAASQGDGQRHNLEALQYPEHLLSSLSDAVIVTDLKFVIRAWNKAAELLYGWKATAAIGKSATQLIPHTYTDPKQDFKKAIAAKGYWKGEVVQKRKDGTSIHVLASVSLVKDATGNP